MNTAPATLDRIRRHLVGLRMPRSLEVLEHLRDPEAGLTELARVIEFYNYRSGVIRTGAYHANTGTEDGFEPGP